MNFIKRLFGKKKAKAKRHYMSSMINNLTSDWVTSSLSADQGVQQNLTTIRARSREQYNNNAYIKQYIRLCSKNVIGATGISLQSRVRNSYDELNLKLNSKIENAFTKWGVKGCCDVSGQLSWVDCQKLFLETVARDGECLVRLHRNFDNPFGFALEFIEADCLDINFNKNMENGSRIRMGIELDTWNRPRRYFLKRNVHYDYNYSVCANNNYDIVVASNIIHGFKVERPGQTRGIPWTHAALFQLHMLNAYQNAELIASRVAACKMGFFAPNEMFDPELLADSIENGKMIKDATPAKFEMLLPGVDFKSFDPQHPTDAFADFSKACLRAASAALGVSYNELANDLEGVNYSSIRAGLIGERDYWSTLQNWVISSFCEPVFSAWLNNASALGHIPNIALDKLDADHWQPPGWDWVDPEKDHKGMKLALETFQKSWSDLVRENGGDPVKIIQQVKHEQNWFKEQGLEELFAQIYKPSKSNHHGDTNEAKDQQFSANQKPNTG